MRIICADAETYFADDFTLSKMTTESYIRDHRFEVHGWAIKWGEDYEPRWYTHEQAKVIFAAEDWSDTAIIAHHAQFDGLILSHCYSVRPRFWFDTLSMARLLLGNHLSVGLDSLARHFNLAAKTVPYALFRGKHWRELPESVQQQVAAGACHDVSLTWSLFQILGKSFPREEFQVVDATVRMFSEPVLRGDIDLLAQVWEKESHEKADRLAELGITAADCQSADRFAELLRNEGVEPETKLSKTTDKEIWAFAKTDEFMRELCEHDNPRVRALAEARLGQKSTLMQTRAETLGWMARRGPMPVYLRYCGAHTTRWSGGDGCLTGDTQILVLDVHGVPAYKKIIDVLLTDLVWDGEEFVEHEGVSFSGYKKVMTWDGVNGTPEHQVFCGQEIKSLSEALRTKTPILDCREPTAWEVEAARRGRETRHRS